MNDAGASEEAVSTPWWVSTTEKPLRYVAVRETTRALAETDIVASLPLIIVATYLMQAKWSSSPVSRPRRAGYRHWSWGVVATGIGEWSYRKHQAGHSSRTSPAYGVYVDADFLVGRLDVLPAGQQRLLSSSP